MTALLTLALLVWVALDLVALAKDPAARPARLTGVAAFASVALFIQLLLGAWVAGLNAGLASDTWPQMHGRFVPEADWSKGLGWALTHDPFLLHFLHRWWAWVVVAELVILGRAARRAGNRTASVAVHTAFGTQILLGIATVLTGVALWLAVLHQLVGALLVAATAWAGHATGKRP
jgi:cytochrome c oxidase assembly protein subunit 15